MRIGIFFGGRSREREVSFAGGRTVYDNLDKSLFEAIPIFVDSFNNFILLDWQYLYKGSIRDFYPTPDALQAYSNRFQVYAEHIHEAIEDQGKSMASRIGKIIPPEKLKDHIDFAFLALHGMHGEDGSIQGLLEWYGIPYSGSGILPAALGMNKRIQKELMHAAGFTIPPYFSFHKSQLHQLKSIFKQIIDQVGFPFVIKPANQGSSVGVQVIQTEDFKTFRQAVLSAFFMREISAKDWKKWSVSERIREVQKICDIKDGMGMPCTSGSKKMVHPDEVYRFLETTLKKQDTVLLESVYSETELLAEGFIKGREFSCIVIRNTDETPCALPPTEIVKGQEVFDYRSKYLPGLSRKVTPIDIDAKHIEAIRKQCEELFEHFQFHVYARIDGFITDDNQLYLNDPNTTSGMMPSSFFFHQAAEIGLNPSQFLTYIIHTSLRERAQTLTEHFVYANALNQLNQLMEVRNKQTSKKRRVAVFMGGYSSERHISVESGRNIYEKLASSSKYEPFPVFVSGDDSQHTLYRIPTNIMLKDNADDILEKIHHYHINPVIQSITKQCNEILARFGNVHALDKPTAISYAQLKKQADAVFIALHGRPGEDGTVQAELDRVGLPYNGSGVESSRITINKFDTNERLLKKGFLAAAHAIISKEDWDNRAKHVDACIKQIGFPMIAKPIDDGCSSAVKKINNRSELNDFAHLIFRENKFISEKDMVKYGLDPKEEFPVKKQFLIEEFVEQKNAIHFLEITGGMLTYYKGKTLVYESFEPSETLAEKGILSLEEKFLAGQGQNLTPSRFSSDKRLQKKISQEVQKTLVAGAKVLKVEGYCRIDAFVKIEKGNHVKVYFIEVNSLPGMTPATAIFHQCALNGYKPYEFIDKILEFGAERLKRTKQGKTA